MRLAKISGYVLANLSRATRVGFGNYVVQSMLEHCSDEAALRIGNRLKPMLDDLQRTGTILATVQQLYVDREVMNGRSCNCSTWETHSPEALSPPARRVPTSNAGGWHAE